ncbi:MAG: S41 family peptidase [Thermoplasmatales archaeon]
MHNLAWNPDIYGDKIAFISGDSVWEYDTNNGSVRKLISGLGVINNVKYFDHGRKIAFRAMYGESANYSDIFSYELESGKIDRLTYLSGPSVARRMFTDIAGFTPEGNIVISTPVFQPFGSMTYLYELVDNGRILRPLNLGPAIHIIYYKDKIYLGRNTSDMLHWKGYKGGTRGKIWAGTVESGFKKIVDLEYHVSSPVIVKDRIYFIYDGGKHGQICSVDINGKDFKTHTDFTEYYPRHLNTDGSKIVFSMGGGIFIFDPDSGSIKEIKIGTLYDSLKERVVSITKYVENFDVNDDNFLSIVGRGRGVITNDDSTISINIEDGLRVRKTLFLGSNKILYVIGNRDGDNLVVFNYKDGKKNTINYNLGNIYHVAASKDGKYVAVANDQFELHIVDLVTGEARLVDRSQEDMITDFELSPDSLFLAYSFPTKRTFFGGYSQRLIKIYDIKQNTIYNVTSDISNDFSPTFSPDGEYLFFLSSRELDPVQDKVTFNFSFPFVTRPYVIPLKEGGISPLKRDIASLHDKGDKYDLEGAALRSQQIEMPSADYRKIVAVDDGLILYDVPIHGEFDSYYSGAPEKGNIEFFDFKSKEIKGKWSNIIAFSISPSRKRILFKAEDGKIGIIEADKLKSSNGEIRKEKTDAKIVNIDNITVKINDYQEYLQMFDETWKMMRDHYWDKRKAFEISDRIYEKYRKLAEMARTRFDLSVVINEMIGEFKTSHCYEMGGEFTLTDLPKAGAIAADLESSKDGLLVKKIYKGDITNEKEKSPLLLAGIAEGDIIKEIDGVSAVGRHPNYFLLGNAGRTLRVRVRKPEGNEKLTLLNILEQDRYIRYRAWVESNREYVHRKSGNRIGYVHIPDMGMMGLNEFFRLYVNESSYESLIVDVRYNGGGFVSQIILEKIKSERLGYDKPRNGTLHPYPVNSVVSGIIAVTNEYAGSDGDIFSYSFKLMKIGKLIGTRTWGGVVGINPLRKLIDGTVVTQPEYSFWFKGVGFGVENYGVDPDIEIEFKPEDYAFGRDPQLDAAISILEEQMKEKKEDLPKELISS